MAVAVAPTVKLLTRSRNTSASLLNIYIRHHHCSTSSSAALAGGFRVVFVFRGALRGGGSSTFGFALALRNAVEPDGERGE